MDYRNEHYNEDGRIDCEINHPEFGWIPFTADPSDVEKLGRDLFAEIQAKGSPAPWAAPADITGQEALEIIREKRNRLLVTEVDPIVTNPLRWAELTAEKQDEWAVYRSALLNITREWPNVYLTYAGHGSWDENSIVWPIRPQEAQFVFNGELSNNG